jgi:hypothetical protein
MVESFEEWTAGAAETGNFPVLIRKKLAIFEEQISGRARKK